MVKGDVSDGTSFLLSVEFTDDDCPTVRTLMAPQHPERYSAKTWSRGFLC
jgi:hypothetical protein